ncbi:MAG: DUF11 domain-containing protein, partial [Actinomycetia bacterium]|nr:DUF11 domain-containing protein [Actinomycetes bacterium]
PDLQLAKDDVGATVDAGQVIVYTLTLANVGNQNAAGVAITDDVPVNTSFEPESSDPGWSCSGSICTLEIGNLAAGVAPQSYSLAFRVDQPLAAGVTEILNNATVADDGTGGVDLNPDDNSASDSTPIAAGSTGPDLQLAKDDGGVTTKPEGLITYTLTTANAGNQDASGVVLTDVIPAYTSFELTGSDLGWSCTSSICTLEVGHLGAGEPARSFDLTFRVDPLHDHVTEITNLASVADDGTGGDDLNPSDNVAQDTTP